MSENKLPVEMYKRLIEPLPEWAIRPHPTKTYLSTINPAAVIERMNEVFGVGAWRMEYDIVSAESKMIVVKGILHVTEYGIAVQNFGGNDNSDLGDAYKGAATDALTKCCSYIGVGLHVWKDDKRPNGKPPASEGGATQQTGKKFDHPSPKQKALIEQLIGNAVFTPEEKAKYTATLADSQRDWSGMITFLQGVIEKREGGAV